MLAEYGVVLVSSAVERETAELAAPVSVTTRGWFEGERDGDVVAHLEREVRDALADALAEGVLEADALSKVAQRAAGRLLGQRYRRQPVILAVVAVL